MATRPFWETKSLEQMTVREWESLCDGCGLCCLVRFEDEDTGEIVPTRVHCRLFDSEGCRCTNYGQRRRHVPDCIKLTPHNIDALPWMPASCAYRRLHEGKTLPLWHPLVTGDPESVHAAGSRCAARRSARPLSKTPTTPWTSPRPTSCATEATADHGFHPRVWLSRNRGPCALRPLP